MHSSTQQTPLFANHGLHHKFDIQGVHKVEDWTMWLVDVWVQFISNLEETQRRHKENAYKHQNEQLNFKFGNQIWFQQHIKRTTLVENGLFLTGVYNYVLVASNKYD